MAAGRLSLTLTFLLSAALIHLQPLCAQPLEGGIEVRVPERPPPRRDLRRSQPADPICGNFASAADASGARLHVMPKASAGERAYPQGRPQRDQCLPPDPSWQLLGEDGNYCCYIANPAVAVVEPEYPERRRRPPEIPPEIPVTDRRRPTMPPGGELNGDPGYWGGLQDGFRNCGESAQILLRALDMMRRGDHVGAAQLLGVTDSAAGLRALWIEIAETQVLGLSSYETGKRQAERLCLYVLLPKATSCAVKATACVAKTTVRSCQAVLKRVGQLRPFPLPVRLPPAPAPMLRGMLLADDTFLKNLAISDQLVFFVRDTSQNALRWIGRPGYAPKPQFLKGKTLKAGDLAGLSPAEAKNYLGLASARGLSAAEIAEIESAGFKIAPPEQFEVISSANGTKFYSDIDLHGVYDASGKSAWSNELASKLNCNFFHRAIQHGPHDLWGLRNDPVKSGSNYGPQVGNGKSVTAYLPDGRTLQIGTLEELKAVYREVGIDWQAIYPGF